MTDTRLVLLLLCWKAQRLLSEELGPKHASALQQGYEVVARRIRANQFGTRPERVPSLGEMVSILSGEVALRVQQFRDVQDEKQHSQTEYQMFVESCLQLGLSREDIETVLRYERPEAEKWLRGNSASAEEIDVLIDTWERIKRERAGRLAAV